MNDTEIPSEEQFYLLCVDDEVDILRSMTRVFRKESFKVLTAPSGREALEILRSTKNIGVILSDQRMPEMTGSAFLEEARKLAPEAIRMILTGYSDLADAVSAINQGGAEQFLTKPWDDDELLRSVREALQRYRLIRENQRLQLRDREQNAHLEEWNSNLKQRVLTQTALIRSKIENVSLLKSTLQQNSHALLMFIDLLERPDHQLSNHSRKVAALTESMTAALNLSPALCKEFKTAALFHDIGLFSVSKDLLDVSLPLMDTAEYRNHSVKGEELLAGSSQFKNIGLIVRHHHENFDGSGFPDGLAGEQIPLGSRIIHIASFIESSYAGQTGTDAKYQIHSKLTAGMGSHFDPALASAAYQVVKEFLED